MNKNIKNIYTFFVILFISLFISCGDSFSSVEKTSVTIKQFESYAITDMDDLEASSLYIGISSDSAVAVLREGKYIYGNNIGTADITVTDGNTETEYNVTVIQNPDYNFQLAISDSRGGDEDEDDDEELTQEDCYIGYCYNAFSGKPFDQRSVSDFKKVFDWNKIIENQNYFIMDDTPSFEKNTFCVSSKSQYINSCKSQTSVSVSASFAGNTLYSNKWSEETLQQSENSSSKEIHNVYICQRNLGFYLNDDGEGYWKYLLPEVQEDYKNLSPEQFINKYGTHVILGTRFGQSFETNYIIGLKDNFTTCIPIVEKTRIPFTKATQWLLDDEYVLPPIFNQYFLDYPWYYEQLEKEAKYLYGLSMWDAKFKKEVMQDVLAYYYNPYPTELVIDAYKAIRKNGTYVVIGGPTDEEIRSLYPINILYMLRKYLKYKSISTAKYVQTPDDSLFKGFLEHKQVDSYEISRAYEGWFLLNLDNRECDRLVGPWNEYSLLPVWELLETEVENENETELFSLHNHKDLFNWYINYINRNEDWKYVKKKEYVSYVQNRKER